MTKEMVEKYVSVEKMNVALSWVYFVVGVSIFILFLFFFNHIDREEMKYINNRINTAFKIEADITERIVDEYAFWDETLERMKQKDIQWIKLNSGDYLLEKNNLDFSFGFINENSIIYSSIRKDAGLRNILSDDFVNGVSEILSRALQKSTTTKSSSDFIKTGGRVFQVTVSNLVSEQTSEPITGAFLVVGREVNIEYLDFIHEKYQLPELHLHSTNNPINECIVATISNENESFTLYWTKKTERQILLPIIMLLMLVFCSVANVVTQRIMRKDAEKRATFAEQLYTIANIDSLTQVSTRRHFLELGCARFNSISDEKKIATLVVDLDFFKEVNDCFGHAYGDYTLKRFASICRAEIRDSDLFGRMGGEEFAFVVSIANRKEALIIAERLRVAVSSMKLILNGVNTSITASIGVSIFGNQPSFEAMIHEADKAMYKAKNTGRNKVCVFNDDFCCDVSQLLSKVT